MSINKSLTIQETFNNAVKNHQEGKTEVAKELYNRVLKIDPNHSQALKNIAIIFANLKDYQKAKEFCEKVDFTTAEKTPGELNGEDCDGTSIAPFA